MSFQSGFPRLSLLNSLNTPITLWGVSPCFLGMALHSVSTPLESLSWMCPVCLRSERARWITALGHSSGKQPLDRTCKYLEGRLLWNVEGLCPLLDAGLLVLNRHHTCSVNFPQAFLPVALPSALCDPCFGGQGVWIQIPVAVLCYINVANHYIAFLSLCICKSGAALHTRRIIVRIKFSNPFWKPCLHWKPFGF